MRYLCAYENESITCMPYVMKISMCMNEMSTFSNFSKACIFGDAFAKHVSISLSVVLRDIKFRNLALKRCNCFLKTVKRKCQI